MYTFSKKERLNNKQRISDLFNSGNIFIQEPFQVIWTASQQEEGNIELLVSVPKKNVKLSSKRNVIKRMIKESYRLNNKNLYNKVSKETQALCLAIIYLKKEIYPYSIIEKKINLILERLNSQL
jgi:ribonuclease P protein component